MKWVRQEHFGESGMAAVSMVTGQPIDWVRKSTPELIVTTAGLGVDRVVSFLQRSGLEHARVSHEVRAGDPAILITASLNYPGLMHYVVWTGEELLDPSGGPKRYPTDFVGHQPMDCFWTTAIVWSDPKTAWVYLGSVQDPNGWSELAEELELTDDVRDRAFEFGEYADLKLSFDDRLNVVGGRVVQRSAK